MNNKRLAIVITILVILLIGVLILIFKNDAGNGNIDNVERIITNENGHKKEDIEETFDMIEDMFNTKDYKGCTLNKITYPVKTQELGVNSEESYKDNYNAEEVIQLIYEFTTNSKPATGLGSNEDYEYKAVFAKIDGKWILKDLGQGM